MKICFLQHLEKWRRGRKKRYNSNDRNLDEVLRWFEKIQINYEATAIEVVSYRLV